MVTTTANKTSFKMALWMKIFRKSKSLCVDILMKYLAEGTLRVTDRIVENSCTQLLFVIWEKYAAELPIIHMHPTSRNTHK